ncbi:MAG: phosphoribosylanthranilate isomerase [Lentisphaeria bacterium]|nr:phosphoribosylanthranilate isomerase [Lentisphaeria bacterium]
MLANAGVNWLGWPFHLPVNQEDLSEKDAAAIIADTAELARHVLITYDDDAEEIARFCHVMGVGTVQLHGEVPICELRKLRESAPGLVVIKSLVVRSDNGDALARLVRQTTPWIDGYITDTFDPETGAEGATGKCHDWEISRKLVADSSLPVVLAGGLNADNVADAILHVRPAGVDVHTGVEQADGRKCPKKVEQFVQESRRAFARIASNRNC